MVVNVNVPCKSNSQSKNSLVPDNNILKKEYKMEISARCGVTFRGRKRNTLDTSKDNLEEK